MHVNGYQHHVVFFGSVYSENTTGTTLSGPLTSAHSLFELLPLVDATELWAPERPDTETVSFPKQCISWTRDIKRRTHNTLYIILFIHHT